MRVGWLGHVTPEALFYDFITLLAIVNPIEAGAAFATLTARATPAERGAIAARASIVAAVILIGFGFLGGFLLKALGIGFPAFRIAGGLLLLQVGFNMVFAKETGSGKLAPDERSAALVDDPGVFPLAIPIITGPGALTTIVAILSKRRESALESVLIVVIVLIVMLITFLTMRVSERLTAILGPTGVNAVGRVMGIIVAAIAIQLVIDGIGQTFPGLARGS